MWSSAFLRRPTYRVLQSVKNGLPPFSLTMSAITLEKFGRRNARLPGSPKWILIAVYLFLKSIESIPAALTSLRSFCSRFSSSVVCRLV